MHPNCTPGLSTRGTPTPTSSPEDAGGVHRSPRTRRVRLSLLVSRQVAGESGAGEQLGNSWGGGPAAAITADPQHWWPGNSPATGWMAGAGRDGEGRGGAGRGGQGPPAATWSEPSHAQHRPEATHQPGLGQAGCLHLHRARPVTLHRGPNKAQQPQEVEPQRWASPSSTTPTRGEEARCPRDAEGRVAGPGGAGGRAVGGRRGDSGQGWPSRRGEDRSLAGSSRLP